MDLQMILTPLAMRVPNWQGVYALSRLQKPKMLTLAEFRKYSAREILVSFEPDGISNPQRVPAYAYGLDCWYLAEPAP